MARFLVAHGGPGGPPMTRVPPGVTLVFYVAHGEALSKVVLLSWIHGKAAPAAVQTVAGGAEVNNYNLAPITADESLMFRTTSAQDHTFVFLGAAGAPAANRFCTCTPSEEGVHTMTCTGLFRPGGLDAFEGTVRLIMCRGGAVNQEEVNATLRELPDWSTTSSRILSYAESPRIGGQEGLKMLRAADEYTRALLLTIPAVARLQAGDVEEKKIPRPIEGFRQDATGDDESIWPAAGAAGMTARRIEAMLPPLIRAFNVAHRHGRPERGFFQHIGRELEGLVRELDAASEVLRRDGLAVAWRWERFCARIENFVRRLEAAHKLMSTASDYVRAGYAHNGVDLAALIPPLHRALGMFLGDADVRKMRAAGKHDISTEGLK